MINAVFVAGTDTEIGKTFVTCALLRHLARAGYRAAGMKPVAAGATASADGLRNDDALALIDASSVRLDYATVNPCVFTDPTSPDIAARRAGARIELAPIVRAYDACRAAVDVVLVEGIGGWRVPLDDSLQTTDLVAALDLPVILVCGIRLGCINHGVLSAESICHDGHHLLGWIANIVDPDYAYSDDTLTTLKRHMPAPLLGTTGRAESRHDEVIDAVLRARLDEWWPPRSTVAPP